MNPDDITRLYNNLTADGYQLGTEEEFRNNLSDKEKARKFYNNLSEDGYKLGTEEEFFGRIYPSSAPAPAKPAAQSEELTPAEKAAMTYTGTQANDTSLFGRLGKQANDAVHTAAQQAQPQPKTGGKMRGRLSMSGKGQARRGLQQTQPATTADTRKRLSMSGGQRINSSRFLDSKKPSFNIGNVGKLEYNPASGKMETMYPTSYGVKANSLQERERLNKQYELEQALRSPEAAKKWEQKAQADMDSRLSHVLDDYDTKNVAEEVWNEAEQVYNDETKAARSLPLKYGGVAAFQKDLSRDKNFDLKELSNQAWDRLGVEGRKSITEDVYRTLRSRYPKELYPNIQDSDLRLQASVMARNMSDQRLMDLAIEKNKPVDGWDYFFRKVAAGNALWNVVKAGNRWLTGSTGDLAAREVAEQQYGKDHWLTNIFGSVAGFALDPLTWGSGGLGSLATKGVMNAAGRKIGASLGGRLLGGAVGGSTMLGTLEAGNEAIEQLKWGGHRNPETGEVEDYSLGAIGKSALRGGGMGLATGMVAPFLGNVSTKLVKATDSTIGKAAIRAGQFATGTVAEGTIFAIPDLVNSYSSYKDAVDAISDPKSQYYIADEQERAAKVEELRQKMQEEMTDAWDQSMAMMMGFKFQHMVKSAPNVIRELAGNQGRLKAGFETRLRNVLDGRPDLALTADEKRELEKGGYNDLKKLTEDYEYIEKIKDENEKERLRDAYTGKAPLHYNRFVELMNDKGISEAARAKMYYYITGRTLPMSTVMASTVTENKDANGNVQGYTVNSVGVNGVITSRTFKSKNAADAEAKRIDRQVELNTIDVGERYFDSEYDKAKLYEACKRFGAENNIPANKLYELMQRSPEGMNEVEREWAERINEMKEGIVDEFAGSDAFEKDSRAYRVENDEGNNVFVQDEDAVKYNSKMLRELINEEYGVDVDKAIRKEPNRRSEQEEKAVKDYAQRLFGDVFDKRKGIEYTGEAPEQGGGSGGVTETPEQKTETPMEYEERVPGDTRSEEQQRGYDADSQERRDIAIAMTMGDEKAQEAWNGVVERINDDADYQIAQMREQDKKEVNEDGNYYPALSKETTEGGVRKIVYIIRGNANMTKEGTMVDPDTSDKSVIIYDPLTGEQKMIDPTASDGIDSLMPFETQADRDEFLQQKRDALVQAELDDAMGVVKVFPNQTITLPTGEQAVVLGVEEDNVYVRTEDGMETYVSLSELQKASDDAAAADYLQRKEQDEIEQQEAEPVQEEEQGELTFNEGDQYVLTDEQGNEYNVALVEDFGNGTVSVSMDGGEPIVMAKDTIQQMVDRTNQMRAAANVEEQAGVTPEADAAGAVSENEDEAEPQQTEQPTEEPQEPAAIEEEEDAMPMVEVKGKMKPDWSKATPSRAREYIYNERGLSRENATAFVKNNVEDAQKKLEKLQKNPPKMGLDLDEFEEKQAQWQQNVDNAQQNYDYWKAIQDEASRLQLDEQREVADDARMSKKVAAVGEPLTMREWLMQQIYGGGVKLAWKSDPVSGTRGLGAHLGLTKQAQERNRRLWLLAGRDKGGMYPEEAAERLLNQYAAEQGWKGTEGDWQVTSQDVFNELMDILRSHDTRSSMGQGILDAHQSSQTPASEEDEFMEDYYAEKDRKDNLAVSAGFTNFAELEAYEDAVEQSLPQLTDEEQNELHNLIVEEYERRSQETGGGVQGGSSVLSGQELRPAAADRGSQGEQGTAAQADGSLSGDLAQASGNGSTEVGSRVLPFNGNENLLDVEKEKNEDNPHIGYSVALEQSNGTLVRNIFYDGRLIATQWQKGEDLTGVRGTIQAAYRNAPAINYDLFVPQTPNDSWEIDGREVIDFDHGDVVRFHDEQDMIDFYVKNQGEIDRRNAVMQPSEQLKATDLRDGVKPDTAELGADEAKAKANGLFEYFKGTIKELINEAKKKGNNLVKKIIAPVSSHLKDELASKGVDVEGYNHVLDNSAIRHTFKQHGSEQELNRGQIPITDEDFERIPDVVENYDDVNVETGKRGEDNIVYSKSYPDGTTIFVEEKRDKRKELAAVTMWKMKNTTLTDANRSATPISDLSGNVSNEIPNESTDSTLGSPVSEGKGTRKSETKQEKKEKVSKKVQGIEGYDADEVLNAIRGDIESRLVEAGLDGVKIKGMALNGSRMRGDAREDSDLDVLLEYEGDISEDGLFNILNETPIEIEGIKVDINPITKGKSGTIAEFLKRNEGYKKDEKKPKVIVPWKDVETDEVFKTNHSEEEQQRLRYQDGETFEQYCERNGISNKDKDALLYFHQKYAGEWGEIERMLEDVGEDPRATGFEVGQLVDSLDEGYTMLKLLQLTPVQSILRYLDGVTEGFRAAHPSLIEGKIETGGEDIFSKAERIAKEEEVKRRVEEFPYETPEQAAAFDRSVFDMSDGTLLAYMKYDGQGDANKAYHMNVYDEYDSRHSDEYLEQYDMVNASLSDMYGDRADAKAVDEVAAMLADAQRAWIEGGAYSEERPALSAQMDALTEWLDKVVREQRVGQRRGKVTENEKALRDGIADHLSSMGVETIVDDKVGQEMVDRANDVTEEAADAPVFVSNALKAVEGIKQEKATPEQWLAMIQKAGGLKAGEDKWMGLSDWLKENKSKTLTKEEVLDFIRENQIQIEEVEYGEPALNILQEEFDEIFDRIVDGVDSDEVVSYPAQQAWEELRANHNGGDDFDMAFYLDDHLNIQIGDENAAGYFFGTNPINSTRLDYTTEGLENKKEIALVVPTIESWNEDDEVHFGDAGDGRAVAWVRFGETTTPAISEEEYNRLVAEADKAKNEFNTYVHSMLDKYHYPMKPYREILSAEELKENDRLAQKSKDAVKAVDDALAKPQRVLVIDEIQSKRHQEGREKGYRKDAPSDAPALIKYEAAKKAHNDYLTSLREKYGRDDVSYGLTKEEEKESSRLWKEQFFANVDYNKYLQENGYGSFSDSDIPDAPFDKNWHELAMKRMLRYAAEHGYDKVAWTKGEQQAERYNIGSAVRSIDAGIDQEGNRVMLIHQNEGGTIDITFDDEGNITSMNKIGREALGDAKNIRDVVGKEIAIEALSVQGRGTENMKTWKGDGLRIGGEGMKGFYDQMLPRFMDKYGKKWGVKTGEVELPNLEKAGQKMWAIDVTPEMKESVMQGQPMFQKVADVNNGGNALQFGEKVVPLQAEDAAYVRRQKESLPKSSAWRSDFPQNVIFTSKVQSRYPELYQAAKSGDKQAAFELIQKLRENKGVAEKIATLVEQYPDAIVAFPHAVENSGINEIPRYLALMLEDAGLKADDSVVAVNRPNHTGSNDGGRIVRRARFDGDVVKGGKYILIDDQISSGATLRDMKDYIESQGGEVVQMVGMTASLGGHKVTPSEQHKSILRELGVTDKQLQDYGIAESIEHLTDGEASKLIRLVNSAGGRTASSGLEGRSGRSQSNVRSSSSEQLTNVSGVGGESQPKYFRTKNGEAYGFTLGGKIYLDPRLATAETPIHEYTHLWAEALRQANPEGWEQLRKTILEEKDVLDYVKRLYPELEGDKLVEEVFAHYAGKRGAQRMRREQARMMKEADGVFEKAQVATIFDKLRRALKRFWDMARDLFAGKLKNIDKLKSSDFADMMMADLSNGVKRTAKSKKDVAKRDAEYKEAVERGDKETERKLVDEAARDAGYTIHAYHGTGRADRIGNVFRPDRATSGPMAFFTDNSEIAESYARGKQDTSLRYDTDYDSYETQFRAKHKNTGKDYAIYDMWGFLPFDERAKIAERAKHIRFDWENDYDIIYDPETTEANGGWSWQVKDNRGNILKALDYQWLASGNLYDKEDQYLKVLELAGVTDALKKLGFDAPRYMDPNYREEAVFDVFLKIQNPFDVVNMVNEDFVRGFEDFADEHEDEYLQETADSDMWDKNNINAEDFAERMRNDIEEGKSYAWTSIPDVMTAYLKSLGYDGIKDTGGKNGGIEHTVWIPFSGEQVKRTALETYDDNGKLIPLSERFNDESNDIRYQKYTTKDGKEVGMRSLFDEADMRGTSTPDTSSKSADKKRGSIDLTKMRLRKLEPGEICNVERRYEESKQFSFIGKEKIESMDDVAYIFKQLEDSAVENAFIVLVKDGRPAIIHAGMGGYTETAVSIEHAVAAYVDMKPDAVYLVHNHPSGKLKSSRYDRELLVHMRKAFGSDVVKDGIIIDQRSGKYGVFNEYDEERNMPASSADAVPLKVYSFSKQAFAPDWDPLGSYNGANPHDMAMFISSHRLGERKKMSFLVVNNNQQITGNFFLPWTKLSDIKDVKEAAKELARYIHLSGGLNGVLYGSYQAAPSDIKRIIKPLSEEMKSLRVRLMDSLQLFVNEDYKSALEWGLMEPESEYGKGVGESEDVRYRLRDDAPPKKTGVGYKVFVLKDGKLYPPMVANPNGEATPVGVWLDADAAPIVGQTKTGRNQVKAGGKGTQGGSGTLSYRPGWHLGEIPYALQFNRVNPETGEKELFPANFVWAEVEYADDVDYQQEAHDAGINANGKYEHRFAGLQRVPENGSYKYRTNPNPKTDPWIITGAMKVNRILKPSEVDEMVKAAGREPQLREAGAVTDKQVEALNQEIAAQEQQKRKEIAEHVNSTPKRLGLKGGCMTQVISTKDELEQVKGWVSEDAFTTIEKAYNEPGTSGIHLEESNIAIIFGDKVSTPEEGELAWFHEQTHSFWLTLPEDKRALYGEFCLKYLKNVAPDKYDKIINGYTEFDRDTEACAYMAEYIIDKYGADKFMSADFAGNEEICNFANELRNYLKYGTERKTDNRLESEARRLQTSDANVRNDLRGRNNQPSGSKRADTQGTGGEAASRRIDGSSGEEQGDDLKAGKPTFEESILNGLLKLVEQNREDLDHRVAAMKAIGGNLSKLRSAMARQREYDKETVYKVVRLAKMLMDAGMIEDLTRGEVKRLLGLVAGAAGKEEIKTSAEAIVDTMVRRMLANSRNLLAKQLKTRGSKLNGKGVEVQGQLDLDGQRMLTALKDGMSLSADALKERMAEVTEKMTSETESVRNQAAIEKEGLMMAQQYHEKIKASEDEEYALKQQLKDAKEEVKGGNYGNYGGKEGYQQFVEETMNAIRENQLERLQAYAEMYSMLGKNLTQSVQRAKAWREQEMRRAQEIWHNANSDLEGVSASEHKDLSWQQRLANNGLLRFFMLPVATFDQMLRFLGRKSVDGKGYLWNRFMGGWTDATDREERKLLEAHDELKKKVSEVMGKKMTWSDLFAMERKMPTVDVEIWDAGEKKTYELTQGNMLYIYLVNKMTDGKMKLRKMGITEEDVEAITDKLNPKFKELGDWMQEEYLVKKREEYNEVYKRLFGSDMASIDHYFPLKINSRSRGQDVDLEDETFQRDAKLGSTYTGSIIKRKRNSLPLDITGSDAFDVLLEHLQQMEHWAAFAELNRDLNTLLSYKKFRNRLSNMSSARFGAGDRLLDNFMQVCAIATGAYRPKVRKDSVDTIIANIAKGVTASKISFRLYTALKQLLSYPAYFSEANPVELAKTTLNPVGWVKSWNWAMDELPGFAKRWKSRIAGDPRLKETDSDWGYWRNEFVRQASKWGMSPNAFVDGLTVAMGAKAIYETKLKKYKKMGYDEEKAKKLALRDASVSFNETQQSSENAYMSAMQLDRTVSSIALSVFRTASMGYQRRMLEAVNNLKRKMKPGYKEEAIAFMKKQMVRDGLSEEQAEQAAKSAYNRSWYHDVANTLIFGYVLQVAWNLGSYLPYLLFGDDDDKKKELLEDAVLHGTAGPIEGLSGGAHISEIYNLMRQYLGEVDKIELSSLARKIKNYDFDSLPFFSDLKTVAVNLLTGEVGAWNDVLNLIVQSGIGVNPQTFTDGLAAIMDYANGDPRIGHEFGYMLMRIAQAPQSQLDELYIDDLGMSAKDAKKLDLGQLAKRYAEYKLNKITPLTGWAYSEEDKDTVRNRYMKRFEDKVKERIESKSDDALSEIAETEDVGVKNLVGKEVAKRAGVNRDTAGENPKSNWSEETKESHLIYQKKRTYFDMAEDILLDAEKKKADENGDVATSKMIQHYKNALSNARKQLGHGKDDEIMRIIRVTRQECLNKLKK